MYLLVYKFLQIYHKQTELGYYDAGLQASFILNIFFTYFHDFSKSWIPWYIKGLVHF